MAYVSIDYDEGGPESYRGVVLAAPGQVFRDIHGDLLRLDKSVPGDATQWVVERWNDGWSSDGEIVETADLAEISADPEDKAPQP